MRIKHCRVKNFGSYKELEFDFSEQGLTLIQGSTGSGKSSLFDIPCWILFGITAKNGNVDEVKNWNYPEEDTVGTAYVETPTGTVTIVRTRGNTNDLIFSEEDCAGIRGKDLKDTQRLLEERLGVTPDLYLTAAYLSEFSPVGSFFTQNSKYRRAMLDKIADVYLANTLSLAIKKNKVELKQLIKASEDKYKLARSNVEHKETSLVDLQEYSRNWVETRNKQIQNTIVKRDNFELEKDSKIAASQTKLDNYEADRNYKLKGISDKLTELNKKLNLLENVEHKLADILVAKEEASPGKCNECGSPRTSKEYNLLVSAEESLTKKLSERDDINNWITAKTALWSEINQAKNPYEEMLKEAKSLENSYDETLSVLEQQKNPYLRKIEIVETEANQLSEDKTKIYSELSEQESSLNIIEDLEDTTLIFRGEVIKKSILEVQDITNKYLEKFFDSELRIALTVEDEDSVDLAITKSGHQCVYSQLSKGQRGLLKLTFSVAVMNAASNKASMHFENIFLDEALDGLDPDLKVKAFNLLSELETKHKSVMVIDHSTEFKSMFERRYEALLAGDNSLLRAYE